jgi:hypothetical protein
MKKYLCIAGIIVSSLLLVGCDDALPEQKQDPKPEPPPIEKPETGAHGFLTGTVIKVYGNLPGFEKSSVSVTGKGISGGGETVRLGESIFGVHIQTTNGVYVIQFQGDRAVTLASMIEVGTQLRFPRTFFVRQENHDYWADSDCDTEYPLFDNNKIGINGQRRGLLVWDQLIEILQDKK